MTDAKFVDVKPAYSSVATIEAREAFLATEIKKPENVWKASLSRDVKEGRWISAARALRLEIGRTLERGEITREEIRQVFGRRFENLREDDGILQATPKRMGRGEGGDKDGADGPGNYGLDRNLTHTFIIAKDGKVVHNLPFPQQVFDNEPLILGAIAEVLGVDHETLGKWLDSGAGGHSARTREGAPSREEMIKRFDKDGDGKLSREEGIEARKALGRRS